MYLQMQEKIAGVRGDVGNLRSSEKCGFELKFHEGLKRYVSLREVSSLNATKGTKDHRT